ncbi:hypothetical protein BG004_005482 [Podila humilis]|nr:hypothetical protein BG004_005482 [Podila humilis]
MTSTSSKHNVLKTKRSLKSLFVDPKESNNNNINQPPKPATMHTKSASTGSTTTVPSYSTFLAELVSSFNSLTKSSSSPSCSATIVTSFEGLDHEAHVDIREKKKVMRALQKADPAQINEVISFLKAMPDPTTLLATRKVNDATTSSPSTKTTTTRVTATAIPTASRMTPAPGTGYPVATITKSIKAQFEAMLKSDPTEEDTLREWNTIQRKRASDRKSNDQATGMPDEASFESGSTTSSWWLSPSTFTSLLSTTNNTTNNNNNTTNGPSATSLSSTAKPAAKTETTKNKHPSKSVLVSQEGTEEKPYTLWATLKGNNTVSTTKGNISNRNQSGNNRFSTGEQIALAAATLMAAAAIARPRKKDPKIPEKKSTTSSPKSGAAAPLARAATLKSALTTTKARTPTTGGNPSTSSQSASSSIFTKKKTVPEEEPSFLISTIHSLARQLLAQQGLPPTHLISVHTFWWGYEIYIPHKCMATIEQGISISQVFLGFLMGAISGIPGLAALIPIAKIISAWVGYQWGVIKHQDAGKGVVISATWILPVALASRSWDHSGNEETPPAEIVPAKGSLKSRLRLLKT